MIRSFLNFKISCGYKKSLCPVHLMIKRTEQSLSFRFFLGQKLDVNEES